MNSTPQKFHETKLEKSSDIMFSSPVGLGASGTKAKSPVVAAAVAMKPKSLMSPAMADKEPKPKVAFASVETEKESREEWRIKCALYFKGSPWRKERSEVFPDASSALSHFALHNMASERQNCSNVLLWIGDIPYTTPKTKQTFIIYPHYDGPRRIEIESKYCLEWAILAFTDDSKPTKLPPVKSKDMSAEDERLMAAVRNIADMGYHVDVWTCRDSSNWDFDIDCIRDFGLVKVVAKRQQDPESLERRERYEAFIRHGVSGFSQDDIKLLDNALHEDVQDEHVDQSGEYEDDYDYADDGYEEEVDVEEQSQSQSQSQSQPQSQTECGPDLDGFLEHQEETITEDRGDGMNEPSEDSEISSHTEDLDMADRLGNSPIDGRSGEGATSRGW